MNQTSSRVPSVVIQEKPRWQTWAGVSLSLLVLCGSACTAPSPRSQVYDRSAFYDSVGGQNSGRGVDRFLRSDPGVTAIDRSSQDLAKLPGVVKVQPGYGVIYVYTDKPAAVPKNLNGIPVQALPSEFSAGVLSSEWVKPEELPPLGQGD